MPSLSIPRRDTLLSTLVLASLAIAAWIYTARMALMPAGMAMGDMSMPMDMPMDMPMSGGMDWTGAVYDSLYLMWAVMMVAMMLPSAAPAILTYRAGQSAAGDGRSSLAARGGFLLGYLATWAGFSAVAALIQLQLNRAMLLTPAGASTRPLLTIVLLLAAGLYQFSPLKRTCLGRCRLPLAGTDRGGAFPAGVAYGT